MMPRFTFVLLVFPVLFLALPQSKKPLTNNDVVSMVKQGVSNSVIVQAIQESETAFDTPPEERARLNQAGVSEGAACANPSAARQIHCRHHMATALKDHARMLGAGAISRLIPALPEKPMCLGKAQSEKLLLNQ